MTNAWIAQTHRRLRKLLERRRLDHRIVAEPKVGAPVIVSRSPTRIVWRIPTAVGDRFMRIEREIPELDADRFVVYVDARKFYRLWLASPHSDSCAYMAKHIKYSKAFHGFSKGEADPVPLADLVALPVGSYAPIEINDGMTRMSWLLTNRASSFPVQVRRSNSPEHIFAAVGLGDGPIPVNSLLPPTSAQVDRSLPSM